MSLIEATPADWQYIPSYMWRDIANWVNDGIVPTSRFLQAVITGDLREAVSSAPDSCVIAPVVRFMARCAPSACWGSPDALKSWPTTLSDMREAS